ncbi:MAG: radical SAM protein [Planctomycetota bacterium]
MPETLRINEIFHSIQGESTWAGCPCVFVRLSGCHLRCHYCDTEYAFREGTSRPLDDIINEVLGYATPLVEVTGGEPLLQHRVHDLMTALCDHGRTVLIETSGACDISECDSRVIRILDLKTPGSGEAERNLWSNIAHLTTDDEVKFVITNREDFEWASRVMHEHDLGRRVRSVLLSAVFEQPTGLEILGHSGLSMRTLAEWILEARECLPHNLRMQTQLHKFIWDPQTRGV